MKFELSRNYKLAFKLLNEGKSLAAWVDKDSVGKASKIRDAISISGLYRYLPTIYDDFESQCQKLNIEFFIDEEAIKEDLRDRARSEPLKTIDELPKAPKDITLHFRVVSDSFMVTGNAAIFTINQQNNGTTN